MLGNSRRFERAEPIAWHINLDRPNISRHRFRIRPVATVPRAAPFDRVRLIAEMLSQFDIQAGLQNLTHHRGQQAVLAGQLHTLGAGPVHELNREALHIQIALIDIVIPNSR
jgi:hypothetical protein